MTPAELIEEMRPYALHKFYLWQDWHHFLDAFLAEHANRFPADWTSFELERELKKLGVVKKDKVYDAIYLEIED